MSKDYSKKSSFKNPDAPATHKQTWTLFVLTKEDYRDKGLTVFEASQLITKLKSGEKVDVVKSKSSSAVKKFDALKILGEAEAAGVVAGESINPTPMVVAQHKNPLDDSSPIEKAWHVPDGLCGFAWVVVKCTNKESRSFISQLKKAKLASSNVNARGVKFRPHYQGGFSHSVMYGNQSIQRKEAYAAAFAGVLCKYGITAYTGSRLD